MFNFPEGHKPEPTQEVEIGNVYKSHNTHKTAAWLVMQITGNTVYLLGIDAEGEISSTASYGLHSFKRRRLIGRVDFSLMNFDIEPI